MALTLGYPWIISGLFEYLIRYLALDPMGPTLANLEKTREDLLVLLVIMQIVLLSLTFLISIFMSHKIAGPLYKLGKIFREANEGNWEQNLSFRKRDYFKELVPDYNNMMASIRERFNKKTITIQSAISSIEKLVPHASSDVQCKLEAILASLKEGIKKS